MKKRPVYEMVSKFKRKYPMTIAWRLKRHSKRIEEHLNPGEKVTYAFAAQKSTNPLSVMSTAVVAITNKRLIVARDRVVVGYFFDAITPDLFNDLKIKSGLFWGKVYIDTAKELVCLSNVDKRALAEIETEVSTFMIEEKKKYGLNNN